MEEEEEAKIIEVLSTLTSSKLSDLTHSILSLTHRHHRRLAALLSSPPIFFLTLQPSPLPLSPQQNSPHRSPPPLFSPTPH
ncbi:hypothetical protein Pint_35528 [Pistacia integerrima]|uniref:Uncharacterized protein n=1 Tax=Pistacia integerrima TaxID=434235 RepID=A0ACC0Y2R2_9ROSI|nr:hypothetical protein Pint_35528 [Pistacia integerrima]